MSVFSKDEFFSIQLADLKKDMVLPFDIYLYLPLSDHIIRVVNARSIYDQELRSWFMAKKTVEVFLKKSELSIFEQYIRTEVKVKAKAEINPTGTKTVSLKPAGPNNAIEKQPEKTPEKPANQSTNEKSSAVNAPVIADAPDSQQTLADLLRSRPTSHSALVATSAVLLATRAGTTDSQMLQDIAIAALIHDVGMSLVNHRSVWKPVQSYDSQDMHECKKHIEYGQKLLLAAGFKANPRVSLLTSGHHEKFDGSGYPQGLKGFNLDQTAQLISFADLLETISSGFYDGQKRSFSESLAVIHLTEKDPSFPQYFDPELYSRILDMVTQPTP